VAAAQNKGFSRHKRIIAGEIDTGTPKHGEEKE